MPDYNPKKGGEPGYQQPQGPLDKGDVEQPAHTKADGAPVIGPGPAPATKTED
jgi:hypothetical protein